MKATQEVEPCSIEPDEIVVVRRGPGANCSSIGSVLDILFLSALVGGAILVGVAAAFGGGAEGEGAPEEPGGDDAGPG